MGDGPLDRVVGIEERVVDRPDPVEHRLEGIVGRLDPKRDAVTEAETMNAPA